MRAMNAVHELLLLLMQVGHVPPRSAAARGTCRVMCFSPKSNVTIPLMSQVRLGIDEGLT